MSILNLDCILSMRREGGLQVENMGRRWNIRLTPWNGRFAYGKFAGGGKVMACERDATVTDCVYERNTRHR